jgi:DNA-binding MarR family transcriptional regulator
MATINRANGTGARAPASARQPAEATSLDACAAAVMDASLLIARFVRAELWRHKPEGLSIAQFRGLAFVNAYPGSAPSEVAEYLMLTRPAVTRLVDELVRRKLLARRADAADRRRLTLHVTAAGGRMLETHFALVRGFVADRLTSLTADERARVDAAMQLIVPGFRRGRVPDGAAAEPEP